MKICQYSYDHTTAYHHRPHALTWNIIIIEAYHVHVTMTKEINYDDPIVKLLLNLVTHGANMYVVK